MTYTPAHIQRLTTQPGNTAEWKTLTFYNKIAGYKRLLVADANGPYFSKTFAGNVYQPVQCKTPDVSNQSKDATQLGKLEFGRIGSQVRQYINTIEAGVKTPLDAVITIQISRWSSEDLNTPIVSFDLFASKSGINVDETNATITLAADNPAKISYISFYDLPNYPGLVGG